MKVMVMRGTFISNKKAIIKLIIVVVYCLRGLSK